MNRDPGTSSASERLAETTRRHLTGWRIPEGVPLRPDTAILPLRPDPDMVRTAARVLHSLLVRTCPDAVIVVGSRGDGSRRTAVITDGALETALGKVAIDLGRAARTEGRLGRRIEGVTGADLARLRPDPGFETIPVLLQILAPGCRVLPILLPEESDDLPADELGRELADLFEKDNVVLVAPLEFGEVRGGPGSTSPKEELRARDAELLRPLLALDLAAAVAKGDAGAVSAPRVLAVAVHHAHARGAKLGHLIEYVRSTLGEGTDAWSGRAGIIF